MKSILGLIILCICCSIGHPISGGSEIEKDTLQTDLIIMTKDSLWIEPGYFIYQDSIFLDRNKKHEARVFDYYILMFDRK